MSFSTEAGNLIWSPSAQLTVGEIEQWIDESINCRSSEIRLGRTSRMKAGAETLVQSALLRVEASGVPVSFTVPELTFSGTRTARATEADRDEAMTPTEGFLSDSLAGLAIALLAHPTDEVASNAVEFVRRRLNDRKGLWGRGTQVSHVETQGIDAVRSESWPNARVASRDAIGTELVDMTASLIGRPKASEMRDRLTRWALDFCFEGLQNARTHGSSSLHGVPIRSIRSLTVRRHNLGKRAVSEALGRPSSHFGEYAQRVSKRRPRVMLEMSVSDGGIGIPASMQRSLAIYDSLFQSEGLLVQEAMWPGSTTDTVKNLESGEGFRKMLRACARLNGYFELRTGRHEFSRTYLNSQGGPSNTDFGDENHANPAFRLESHGEKPYVGGTTLTMIFPLETS